MLENFYFPKFGHTLQCIMCTIISNFKIIFLQFRWHYTGNDPHFFMPLPNGDNLCYSVQGQPDFMFSLIKDKYVQRSVCVACQ